MEPMCVSLDTARKMKAAGWTKETRFYRFLSVDPGGEDVWHVGFKSGGNVITAIPCCCSAGIEDCEMKAKEIVPAPTAEEILNELPDEVSEGKFLGIVKFGTEWSVQYAYESGDENDSFDDESLSEAAAAMWLWLRNKAI